MKFIAKISWLTALEGGRTNDIPFNTSKYAPLIRTEGSRGNWSLIVNNYGRVDDNTTIAMIYYLAPESAPDNLVVGLKFDLYEGNKRVAFGEIIDKAD